ncbi:Uma2 family endonuclease [Deinococcus puniceus]|uniref:Putative restriction endonuclease domain-containing protein n=1 Tax=Deinococcus puniceus TaxID=1182568 RepID=A0A172T9S8_9DEIO|nr:Uma2 family endonuclease [Deinococcus puniceus]ANE43770.1 hypothetical protein SU48_08275 [Deinococcus puniceus]
MSHPPPVFWEMTEEEYLRTEPLSPFKREFVAGYVYPLHGDGLYAQAGASSAHGEIVLNIAATLLGAARRQGCRVYAADMRVNTSSPTGKRVYFYPDVVVTCEPMTPESVVSQAPCLLIEVLSPSTGHTDRTDKVWAYTSLPSLQMYLIVSPSQRHLRVIERTADGWQETERRGQEAVDLACLGSTLTLDEVYAGVLS